MIGHSRRWYLLYGGLDPLRWLIVIRSFARYWGTLEDVATVPDANFTALLIIGSTVYGLILTEIGIASTYPSECRMTTTQKGILKRSLLVAFALFFHGLTTTGYVQDHSGNLQAVTSVLMVIIVFSLSKFGFARTQPKPLGYRVVARLVSGSMSRFCR